MGRFLSPRWLVRHAVMILLVTAFLSLGWWQVSRAVSGNTLSYAYAAEWPLFALFVFALWVREIRAELRPPEVPAQAAEKRYQPVVVPVTDRAAGPLADDDPALAAYNDYLAWLAANPDRRPAEYRPIRQGE